MALKPLTALRLRLTAWYVATLGLILLLLGLGLFFVIRRQFSRQLEVSLSQATLELQRAARIGEQMRLAQRSAASPARGLTIDAVDQLHIPDRQLFLMDSTGQPVTPLVATDWVRAAAQQAARNGTRDDRRRVAGSGTLRLHAEKFRLSDGVPMISVVVANQAELEDHYAALIIAFAGAAIAALILVAAGGYFLSYKSTEPVERNIARMQQFMADAAHELRTPIAVMRTTAEVAQQDDRSPDDSRAALNTVEREARRLGGIVDDLLTLARADAGERPVRLEKTFLDDVVLDIVEASSAFAAAQNVHLDVGDFEEAPLDADAELLHQLVMNLVHNAIKFTPAGGRVRLDVAQRDGRPTLLVEDNGIGIEPGLLPHVFERFVRGDPARGRSEGAGLGLSIARWIADVHGADLRLEAAQPRGTRALVSFPRHARVSGTSGPSGTAL